MDEKLYVAFGELKLKVSLKLRGATEEETVIRLHEYINSYNLHIDKLGLNTVNGNHIELKVVDSEISWDELCEDEGSKKKASTVFFVL